MDDRFQKPTRTAMMLCNLPPKYVIHSTFDSIKEGTELFLNLLSGTAADVSIEFEAWKLMCSQLDDPPTDAAKAIDLCHPDCFPNTRQLLIVFATLPVSTACAERSFPFLNTLRLTFDLKWQKVVCVGCLLPQTFSVRKKFPIHSLQNSYEQQDEAPVAMCE